jgi:putative flippase GtrA
MTPDLRRRLAFLLVGVAAMYVGLAVRQRVLQAPTANAAKAAALGALAGIAVAVMLWRTFTFFVARGHR